MNLFRRSRSVEPRNHQMKPQRGHLQVGDRSILQFAVRGLSKNSQT